MFVQQEALAVGYKNISQVFVYCAVALISCTSVSTGQELPFIYPIQGVNDQVERTKRYFEIFPSLIRAHKGISDSIDWGHWHREIRQPLFEIMANEPEFRIGDDRIEFERLKSEARTAAHLVRTRGLDLIRTNINEKVLLDLAREVNHSFLLSNRKNEFDISLLLTPELEKDLKLSSRQLKAIDRKSRRAWELLEERRDVFFDLLGEMQIQHYGEFLATLNPTQRKQYKIIAGDPIQYFKEDYGKGQLGPLVMISQRNDVQLRPEGKFDNFWDLEREVDDHPMFVDRIWESILAFDLVSNELDLTQKQRRELRSWMHLLYSKSEHLDFKDRLWWLMEGSATQPSQLNNLFTELQVKVFQQIEFQIRVCRNRESFGLLHPTVIQFFELDSEQVAEIKQKVISSKKTWLKAEVEFFKELAQIRTDSYSEILETLTEDQELVLRNRLPARPVESWAVPERVKRVLAKESELEKNEETRKSFSDKIDRKIIDVKNLFIEDFVGVRAVLYYKSDVEDVCSIIEKEFMAKSVDEHQPLLMQEDRFGYLSRHFIVKTHKSRAALSEWQKYADVKAEIQVRTVLQHAWASVSHSMDYKKSDMPGSMKRRLYRLASMFEIADDEFDAILLHQGKLKERLEKGDFEPGDELDNLVLTRLIANSKTLRKAYKEVEKNLGEGQSVEEELSQFQKRKLGLLHYLLETANATTANDVEKICKELDIEQLVSQLKYEDAARKYFSGRVTAICLFVVAWAPQKFSEFPFARLAPPHDLKTVINLAWQFGAKKIDDPIEEDIKKTLLRVRSGLKELEQHSIQKADRRSDAIVGLIDMIDLGLECVESGVRKRWLVQERWAPYRTEARSLRQEFKTILDKFQT